MMRIVNFFLASVFFAILSIKFLIYIPWEIGDPDFFTLLNIYSNQFFTIPFFLNSLVYPYRYFFLGLFISIFFLIFIKKHWFIQKTKEENEIQPLIIFIGWVLAILGNQFFDINPQLLIASSLTFLTLFYIKKRYFYFASAILVILFFKMDGTDLVSFVFWSIGLYFLFNYLNRYKFSSKILVLFYLALLPQYFSAFFPLLVNFHGGKSLGKNLAYDFCQSSQNNHIFATVPQCPSMSILPTKNLDCRNGYIAEYDSSMREVKKHRFFTNSFYGRLEKISCQQDSLLIALFQVNNQNAFFNQNILNYSPNDKNKNHLLFPNTSMGNSFLEHEKSFYFASENNADLFFLSSIDARPIKLSIPGLDARGLYIDLNSVHSKRNSFFPFDYLERKIFEINLKSFKLTQIFEIGSPGILGVTVDEEFDRMIISDFWGIQIFDFKTHAIIKKIKTGLLPRAAKINYKKNLIYVPTTIEGKIRIYDRKTFSLVEILPIGFGTRYLEFTNNLNTLLASSLKEHFYWDSKEAL